MVFFSEELHEDKNFKGRDRAALLAAKVFYHLNAFPDALHYALQAGELFDLSQKTEFVETLISAFLFFCASFC
jgi:26S proteasome regulatory subunit N2